MPSPYPLPDEVARLLIRRWSEPHRAYHGVSHLVAGLGALERLGGGRLEQVAFWCHDAVHSNTTPDDERASAALATDLLDGVLPEAEVAEVVRLILLTAGHRVEPGDDAGARVCDADLSGLGAPWEEYLVNVAGIRAELPRYSDEQWRQGRSAFLRTFLRRDRIYATRAGFEWWEGAARANLRRELAALEALA